jgi:hypothetical protein
MDTSKHYLFLFSPLLIGLLVSFSTFTGYDQLIEIFIMGLKGYAVAFFLFSSYFVFRFRKVELETTKEKFLIENGYPGGATIFFAWLFLLPIMKVTVGMWNSEFLNMLVTLAISLFLFYFLIGVYEVLSQTLFKNSKPPAGNSKS